MNTNSEQIIPVKFSRGDIIISEGDEIAKHLIIVNKGSVGVYKNYKNNDRHYIKSVNQGEYYSVYSLFLSHPQTETLVAMSDAVVSFVKKENIRELFTQHTDTAIKIVGSLCKELAGYIPVPTIINQTDNQQSIKDNNQPEEASSSSPLFPEDHGSYTLPLSNSNEKLVYSAKTTCPLFGFNFESLGIFMSRLRRKGTDPDSRERYIDVEPIYYEIITCPNCLLSVDYHTFSTVDKKSAEAISDKVGRFQSDTVIKMGRERDTFSVFAGYYLAILCAPVVFYDHQVKTGGLWLKLSRLYSDCEDKRMERYALEKSFEDFQFAYMKLRLPESQGMQVCFMLGELHYKLDRFEEARNSFYAVKTNMAAGPSLKRQADRRLDEIREEIHERKNKAQEQSKQQATEAKGKRELLKIFKKPQ